MKSVSIFLLCFTTLVVVAQNEPDSVAQSKSGIVSEMGGIAYSSDNSAIYRINIQQMLKMYIYLHAGFDSLDAPTNQILKKAFIYFDGKSGVYKIFITSEPFQAGDDEFVCDYASYLDDKGLVHELFLENPKDKVVIEQLCVFLANAKQPKIK